MSRIPDHIENPSAYADAIQRNIKMNARIGRERRFKEAEPELYAQLTELWHPHWAPCCDAPALNEWGRCENCGGEGGTKDWQKDGSHLVLEHFTPKQHRAINRKISWLRDGYEEYGSLTENQAAKAKQIIEETIANVKRYEDEDELRKLNATPWEAGRQEFRCTVVSAQVREVPSFNPYSRGSDLQLKIIVQREDGSRLWCTAPSALIEAIGWYDYEEVAKRLRQAELTLRVGVEPAEDDPIFAFGKRPHLVELHAAPNQKTEEE